MVKKLMVALVILGVCGVSFYLGRVTNKTEVTIKEGPSAPESPAIKPSGSDVDIARDFRLEKELAVAISASSEKLAKEIIGNITSGESREEALQFIAKSVRAQQRGAKRPGAGPEVRRPPGPSAPEVVQEIEVGNSPSMGPKDAKVTIVEFSDFQCPFCSRVQPSLTKIMETYPDKVRIVFKSNPLPFHKDAPLAHEAALAAGEQGKFWEFHDKLFANQRALDMETMSGYAKDLGLNVDKFEKDIQSGKLKEAIGNEQAEARKAGAGGTPTFFINGRRLVGAQPFESFQAMIEEELKK